MRADEGLARLCGDASGDAREISTATDTYPCQEVPLRPILRPHRGLKPAIDTLDHRDLPSAAPASAALRALSASATVRIMNDSLSDASNLGSITGTKTQSSSVGGTNDPRDYYRFTAQRGKLEIRLSGLSADLDFELLNGGGGRIGSAAERSGTQTETKNYTLAGGTYYVKVYPGTSSARSNYSLRLKATPSSTAPTQGDRFLLMTGTGEFGWSISRPSKINGEAEGRALALQAVNAQVEGMANIRDFEQFSSSRVTNTISGKYQSLGPLQSFTATFSRDENKQDAFRANRRGLVVTVQENGFKPGTFANSSDYNRLTGVRKSRASGILLYTFRVYAPEGYRP